MNFVQQLSKSELSSQFLGCSKFETFPMPLFGKFSRSSQDLGESDYDSINSRDDQLNSSKSGMWIFGDQTTGNVLLGTEEMSCLEHRRCPAWNTRDVLLGTHEMSCLEHTRCPVWNTRDVLFGTQEMSCVDHRKWWYDDVMIRYDERVAEIVWWRFHAKEQNRHGHLLIRAPLSSLRKIPE